MSGKNALIMAVLLVAVVALIAGCAGQSKTAKYGDNVSVYYALWVDNNTTIIETNNATIAKASGIYDEFVEIQGGYEPLTFTVGKARLLPDFQNATIGMKVGETKNITLSPSQAYGEFDPMYIQQWNMSDFVNAGIIPFVNQTLPTRYGPIEVYSIQVNERDYNQSIVSVNVYPMAGKTLHFMISLESIEPA